MAVKEDPRVWRVSKITGVAGGHEGRRGKPVKITGVAIGPTGSAKAGFVSTFDMHEEDEFVGYFMESPSPKVGKKLLVATRRITGGRKGTIG